MQEYLSSLDITVEKSCGRLIYRGEFMTGNIDLELQPDGTVDILTPWKEVIGTIKQSGNIVGVNGEELNKSDLITIHPSDRETNRQKPRGQPSAEKESTNGFSGLIQRVRNKIGL